MSHLIQLLCRENIWGSIWIFLIKCIALLTKITKFAQLS